MTTRPDIEFGTTVLYVCAGVLALIAAALVAMGYWASGTLMIILAVWTAGHPVLRRRWYRNGRRDGYCDGYHDGQTCPLCGLHMVCPEHGAGT
jgi:hypothetical protein